MTPAAYYYTIQIVFALLQFAFFAGVAWMMIRQTRKDVNGVGAKMRALEKQNEERHRDLAILLLLVASDEARSKIAAMLLAKDKS